MSDEELEELEIVQIEDIEGPIVQLCYKQDPKTMHRCDRKINHGGMHVWEMWAKIQELSNVSK